MQGFARKRKLTQAIRDDLMAAISYFKNHLHLMDYASHVEQKLPIGSGVIEAACKTLIKQRFCCSGMRWKEAGIKTVLSLRSLIQTPGRSEQFWNRVRFSRHAIKACTTRCNDVSIAAGSDSVDMMFSSACVAIVEN